MGDCGDTKRVTVGGDPGGGAEATVIGPLFQQGDDVRESVAFCGTFCPKH